MLSERTFRQAIRRIRAVAQPSKIILFGSYARGEATEDSDLDLMIILPGKPDKMAEIIRLRRAIGALGVGVDVLVFSEDEAQRRGQVPGTVVYWANKEGRIVYDATA